MTDCRKFAETKRVLYATPEAWRYLGYWTRDEAGHARMLPLEWGMAADVVAQ